MDSLLLNFRAFALINLNKALSFSAKVVELCEITVSANQSDWDAISSEAWCIITKNNSKAKSYEGTSYGLNCSVFR
ncbi:MAG: hypothetical protein LBL90_03710 [Prevotellaceae bacterium]|nr:hypothetical protein [Prevotellaceae bacterium]